MGKTSVYAYLSISGEYFPIDIVTERLKIEPTRKWNAGDLIKPEKPMRRSYTNWEYEVKSVETLDVNDVLVPLIQTFENKVEIIQKLQHEYDLYNVIRIVIQIYDGHTPGLVIPVQASTFAAAIGADFDIDLYAFSYKDQYDEMDYS